MELTERIIIIGIGAACVFAVSSLLMGWTAENWMLILSFIAGTFFPSITRRAIGETE